MAPRSLFSREREGQVKEHCEELIRGTLQDNATPENIETALEWCLNCINEHRHGQTVAADVASHFRQMLDKLRIHSQLDAADYLESQRAAFAQCRLSRRFTTEAHASALQAVLLLARQPTRVPLRMVRSLRAIRDGRRARAAQQRRSAGEQAQDRRMLLELELQQVAEAASQAWREAWAEPDSVPESGPAKSEGAATEASEPASTASTPRDGRQALSEAEPQGPVLLPKGALPRQLRPSSASCAAMPEQALVETALQMFAGHAGDGLGVTEEGRFAWRSVRVPHLSAEALRMILEPLAEFGTTLRHFRSLVAVVQSVAPWLGKEELRRQVARAAMNKRLSLRELAKLQSMTPSSCRKVDQALADGQVKAPTVFGLCWQSACLVLEELLEEVGAKFRHLQASSYCVGFDSERAAREGPQTALTLMQLDRHVAPYRRAAWATGEVLDAALAAVAQRCCERPAAQWPEAASEELLAHLARALRSAELVGRGDTWLGRLWCGSMCPPVRVMHQWGATGTLHDPCNEFMVVTPPRSDKEGGASQPALLLKEIVIAGRHVRSLQEWSQVGAYLARHDPAADIAPLHVCIGRLKDTPEGAPLETASVEPYVPLEVKLEAYVLRPALQLADEVSRPLLLRVLQEESGGLLRHLAALRLVAFLERDDVVLPLTRCLFEHVEGQRSRATPEHLAQDALAIDLNSALLEGLEQGKDQEAVRQLCAKHLVLALAPGGGGPEGRGQRRDGDACACLDSLRIVYTAPPPLDRVLGEPVLRAYSAIMALLLRVRYAKAAMSEVHNLPLFGLCDWHRRARSRRLPPDFVRFTHSCDVLRAEVAHLLGCVERHLQVSVLQSGTRTLQSRLQWLVDGRPPGPSESPHARSKPLDWDASDDPQAGQCDMVETATHLHGEYVHQLMQECFLAPELHAVLTDIQQLLAMAVELRDLLVEMAERLQPGETGLQDAMLEEEAGPSGRDMDFFCQHAWRADAGVLVAQRRVADLQREFRGCIRYLLQVLMFSVGRGTVHQVSNLCSQINFNGFYHDAA